MMEKRTHLGDDCPGRAYFERKAKTDEEAMRKIFTEVMGDVPKYMQMAGDNRIWLWVLSAAAVVTGIILIII